MNMLPLSWFTDRLDRGEHFGFSRYGDGEFNCILGAVGENGDHHPYSPELAEELRQTLVAPGDFQYAIGPKALHRGDGIGDNVRRWLEKHAPPIGWVSTETFLEASLAGQLEPFVAALKRRKLMIVGPAHLRALPFTCTAYVETPLINCYGDIRRIEREITEQSGPEDAIILSAGMIKNVLIYNLYPSLGKTMIDCGSVWDMYFGHNSRRYARKMQPKVLRRLKAANGL